MSESSDKSHQIDINEDHDLDTLPSGEGSLVVEERDGIMVDDDDSIRDVPVLSRDVDGSLPTVDEMHVSESFSAGGRSGHIARSVPSDRKKKYRSYIMLFTIFAFVVAVVIAISFAVTSNKNDGDSSATKSTVNVADDRTDAEKAEKLADVISYLMNEHEIDITDLSSPQYEAAKWCAEVDDPSWAIPGSWNEDDYELYAYRFLARYIMALLYYSVDGENGLSQVNFLKSGQDICDWHIWVLTGGSMEPVPFGALCGREQYIPNALFLPVLNMTGSIPTELGLLTKLEIIEFYLNDLEGSIPTELCNLKELKSLRLSYNTMEGKIPNCIGDMQMLQILDLSDNMLEGTLPSALKSIGTLRGLYVDDNFFDGNPVDVWQGLTNIESLHAYNNNFTGDLNSLFAPNVHTKLQTLDLSHNAFTSEDVFPNHLLSMSSLIILDASANKLSGKFPSTIEVNPNLAFLSMYDNSISGKITGSIKNLTKLVHFDLSNNRLTGPMVSELGEMQELARLYLSNNPNLEPGDVPESYANLTMLRELSLRNTSRTGSLPEFLGNNILLMLLDLGSNNFSGPVPSSWKNLTNIEYLLLNANHDINGDPSETLSSMIKLRAGFLDGTSVQGNFSDLCEAWSMLNVLPGDEVLFADCAGVSAVVTCACCTCCGNANETGCSDPFLSNLDGETETGFKRDFFQFTNETTYTGNYQNRYVPQPP